MNFIRTIKVRKKENEWRHLQTMLNQRNDNDYKKYIASRIRAFSIEYKSNPEKILQSIGGKTMGRVIPIDEATYSILLEISEKTNKPIGELVDQLFIIPLLYPKQ